MKKGTIIIYNPIPINGRVRYTNKSNKEDKPVLIAEGDRYGIRLV